MTIAASVACGIIPIGRASSSIVARVAAAVTTADTWLRAPAKRFTAVWLVPPPAGMAPSTAPQTFATPVASSSRFACSGGSSLRANARPAAMVSVKLISAMPSAAGHRS
jgi:hypothetical protein